MATPDERNRLARQLFAEAVIKDRTAVAVKPRPELLPFFVDLFIGGSDGHCLRGCILPPEAFVIAIGQIRKRAGASRRDSYQIPRTRKLTAEAQSRLRAVADGRSLRSLGSEFGISHESVRQLLNELDPVAS